MNSVQALAESSVTSSKKDLENSFSAFTQLASDLTIAYQELEDKVSLLTSRLEHVTQERLQELTEKELLANRLQRLLDILPAAVVVIDGNGIVQECNSAASELLQTPLLYQSWRQVIQKVFSPKADDGCEVSLKDGRRISLVTKALEEEPGQILVMSDLTETRALQEQLARDRHLKDMGKMVASLAHQIRTPLTAALLYASNLEDNYLREDQVQQSAGKLKKRLQNIEQQVKDMLTCAKGGRLSLSAVSLEHFLKELCSACQDRIQLAHVTLRFENKCLDNPQIFCHLDTLVGAFCNLINNAIETCKDNLEITVQVKELQKHCLQILIQDNGPGMDSETLHQIQEPFFTTRKNGTGLGLDIVTAVIDEHNGQLTIESTVGVGTRVGVRLPIYTKECVTL